MRGFLIAFAAGGLAAGCFGKAPFPAPRPIWLDVDPAVMRGGHEPDDGVAMVQAFHSPELRVVGVSTVFGNAPVETGHAIAREIAARFGPPGLGVHRGAAAPAPEPTPASRALLAALAERPLTVLALGPATNIAAALRERPDLARRLEAVVLVIGRRPDRPLTFPGSTARLPDFNFEMDPQAAEIVLRSGAPVVLVPFELAVQLPVEDEEWARLRNTAFGNYFLEPIEDYLDWFSEHTGRRATYPFDSFAVSWLAAPELLRCDRTTVVLREGPADTDRGSGGSKPWLVRVETGAGTPVTWCHTPEPELKDELLRRLAGGRGA